MSNRSNLIGTPEQIAERVLTLKDAGADLILPGFLHFQEEVELFGKRVIPLCANWKRLATGSLSPPNNAVSPVSSFSLLSNPASSSAREEQLHFGA